MRGKKNRETLTGEYPFSPEMLRGESPYPRYVRVCNILREYLSGGAGLAAGKLPGEIELAAMFKVSRKTVSNAVAMLASERLVCRIKRRGTVLMSKVAPSDPQSPAQKIGLAFPVSWEGAWRGLSDTITDSIKRFGYRMKPMLFHWGSLEEEEKVILEIRRECAGMIFYPDHMMRDALLISKLDKSGFPFVLFDICPPSLACNAVMTDHYMGAYRLAECLFKEGKKRPALISPAQNTPSETLRFQGYIQALRDSGLRWSERLIYEPGESHSAARLGKFLRAVRADALASPGFPYLLLNDSPLSDTPARRAVSAVTFDAQPETLEKHRFITASAVQPEAALGEGLTHLLSQIIRDPGGPRQKILIEPEIITQKDLKA